MKTLLWGLAAFAFWGSTAFISYSSYHEHQRVVLHYLRQSPLERYTDRAVISASDTDIFRRVQQYKRQGQAQKAIALLEQHSREVPEDIEATFLLAYLYLDEQHQATALGLFQQVYAHRSSGFSADAAWFIALIHLYNDQPQQAAPLLRHIVLHRSSYTTKCRALVACW